MWLFVWSTYSIHYNDLMKWGKKGNEYFPINYHILVKASSELEVGHLINYLRTGVEQIFQSILTESFYQTVSSLGNQIDTSMSSTSLFQNQIDKL